MDDADLNDNIGDHTEAVDDSHHAIKTDQIHLDPSRWWFASAAFPMIAGTLGPVASAFSICALARNWRQQILPGSDVTKAVYIPDPPWLYAVNGVQLFIALLANVFLLLNMTKRVRFSIAQPITITGWYISSICLVALCATAGGPLILEPQIDYVWSQAFYYGLFSAILYFIVSSLMVVTVWGAEKGHYGKDFELTTSQRTLMLQTIVFLVYLLIGALVFSTVEGWSYLDAVYWADATLFTVGFGDVSPQTMVGRGLLIPYALVGIISFGLVIGSIRSLILDRGKRRLDARMLEKKRRHFIRGITRKGNAGMLEPVEDESFDYFPEAKGAAKLPQTEFERRKKEFYMMRKIQDQASKRRRWTAMAVSTSTWAALWLVGAKIFQECESPYQGWTYFDGVYFAFTALTTIGYGDLTPVSNSAKAFFVFWSLLALPTQTVLISNAGDTVVKAIRDGTLRLGNLTILPGNSGFKKDAKQLLGRLSCGALFADEDDDIEEEAPGFFGAGEPHSRGDKNDDTDRGTFDNSTSSDSRQSERDPEERGSQPTPASTPAGRDRSAKNGQPIATKSGQSKDTKSAASGCDTSTARRDIPTQLPKSRSEYHLVLIDEIARVTKHLQHSPPRKYAFKEWAWYLRLIGEDETSAETHRKPVRRPLGKDADAQTLADRPCRGKEDTDDEDGSKAERVPEHGEISGSDHQDHDVASQKLKWSWVGHRSPLMDTREEAGWILEKLEQKLREELQAVVREQEGRGGLRDVATEERRNEQKALGPTPMQ